MDIKKDDKVMVLSGKDKGAVGKVLHVVPKNDKVVVASKPRSMPAKCSWSAPNAASRPASATRSTERIRSASAASAVRKSEKGA